MAGMPGRSGGPRIGSGRKTGTTKAKVVRGLDVSSAKASGITPLKYMLAVLRDPKADVGRRDRMAMAAAPYCHPKIQERPIGLKAEKQEAAKTAGLGSEWGNDLISPVVRFRSIGGDAA